MATRKYGLSAEENLQQVTEGVGAAVGADSIELTVDLAGTGLTTAEGKRKVLMALELFKQYITVGNWPPA